MRRSAATRGGQVNVITRSGSNRFDGTAYEFFRNGALDARNYFAPEDEPAPDYDRHQFGGSIGGPLARDRAFFFADYEGTRLREGITRVTNVPTAAERHGDFSQSLFARPVNPFTRQPFPGRPAFPLVPNPIGPAIAALYPLPNRATPFANYVSSPTLRDDVDQFDAARRSHARPAASRLTARYSFSDRRLFEPFAGTGFSTVPGFGNDVAAARPEPRRVFTHDDARLVAGQRRALRLQPRGHRRLPENTGARQRVGRSARAVHRTLAMPGMSLISVAGFSPLGHEYNNPQESTSDTFQIADTLTWMRGAHLVKAGGEWHGIRQSAYRDVQARGFLTFLQQGYTGNALADLLLGLPALTGGARLDNPQNLRARSWSLFAHDDWRALPSLTVSAGLRYDYVAPPVDSGRSREPVRRRHRPARAGGHRQHAARRLRARPQQHRAARRVRVDARHGSAHRGPRRLRHLLQPGGAGDVGGAVLQPALLQPERLLSVPGLPPLTAGQPVPVGSSHSRSRNRPRRISAICRRRGWNTGTSTCSGNSARTRAVEIAYVGSRGHDLISARDLNQPPASPSPLNLRPNPLFCRHHADRIASVLELQRPAAEVSAAHRARGLSLLAAYTLGKSTDDASGFFTSAGDANFPQNSLDPAAERARSAFDVRHRLSVSAAYALPFRR